MTNRIVSCGSVAAVAESTCDVTTKHSLVKHKMFALGPEPGLLVLLLSPLPLVHGSNTGEEDRPPAAQERMVTLTTKIKVAARAPLNKFFMIKKIQVI